MTPLVRVFLLSVLFCLVLLRESLGAPTAAGRSVNETSPGDDALQGKDMRQEWQETKGLGPRTRDKTKRWDAEMKALVEGLERRIKGLENRMSALEEVTSVDTRGREEFDRLNGRLSRLEDCLQRAEDGCSPAGAPPTPSSSPIPSTAHSSTTSSTSSPTSASTSSATTNYISASTFATTSSAFPSTTTTSSPTSSFSFSFNPSFETSEFLTSASVSTTTPAPWAWQASEAPPSAASAAPPTADPTLRNSLGNELYHAARDGQLEKVGRLLDAGADPNYANGRERITPLMEASSKGHASVVSLLLRRGADVHAVTIGGWTALHYAAYLDRSGRAVPLLVAAGARVDSRDSRGQTPLHIAAVNYNEAAVRALVAAGASKTLKDDFGIIPLLYAKSDAVRALLHP